MSSDLPFHLGLRKDGHVVSVIKQNGRTREQLGVAYPLESNPRHRILAQWGINGRSPRLADPDTIDVPLKKRAQAILSYQVNEPLQHSLNTGMGTLSDSRQRTQPGLQGRTHLGPSHPLMINRPRGFHSIESPRRGVAATDSIRGRTR